MEGATEGTEHTPRQRIARRWLAAVLVAALIAGIGLALNARNLLFVETLDKILGDLRITLLSPRAPQQRDDIAIVLIDETTLRDYTVLSPVSGSLIGELVREIDATGPKEIGLDFIFDRRTEHTEAMLAAIRAAKSPIIMGAIDARLKSFGAEGLAAQEQILAAAGRPAGHLVLERKTGLLSEGAAVVRGVAGRLGLDGHDSFSAELAHAGRTMHNPGSSTIAWLRPPVDTSQPLFVIQRVPRHKPADLGPGAAPLLPDYWAASLAGRIVLIGADLANGDKHPTPLNVLDEGAIPGVLIHAQALAQRLDGNRDIRPLGLPLAFLVVLATALACFAGGRWLKLHEHTHVYQYAGLALVGVLSFAAFGLFRLDLPSGPLAFAWLAGAFSGHHSDTLFRWLRV